MIYEFKWVSTGEKVLFPCSKCGGKYEHLRVEPPRSPKYLNQILFCESCKHIWIGP